MSKAWAAKLVVLIRKKPSNQYNVLKITVLIVTPAIKLGFGKCPTKAVSTATSKGTVIVDGANGTTSNK